jgi:PAS domain S-box-containing protein
VTTTVAASLDQLFRNGPLAIWLFDLQSFQVISVNDAALAEYGFSRSDFLRRDAVALGAMPQTAGNRFDAGSESYETEWQHKTEDGQTVDFELIVQPVNLGDRPAGIVIARDVTEERRMRERAGRLDEAVESAGLAVVTVSLDGWIQSWNAAATRLLGYEQEEAVGRPLAMLLPEESSRDVETWLTVIANGRRVRHHETHARTNDDRAVEVALSITPTFDADGRVVAASLIGQDITVRKNLEDQLRQAQKMEAIGRLAGGIAHDFNNLLTAIAGYSQLLVSSLETGDERRTDAEQIQHAAGRAADLTRQLLAFSRRQVLHPAVLSLNDAVVGIQPMLDRLLGDDITLVVGLDPNAGNVRVDRSQLEQVVLNLSINGRDAMPDGGTLLIETAPVDLDDAYATLHAGVEPGRYAVLAVSDQGVGLSDEARAHLFEPFFTTKPSGQGTGLGLATVYGVVSQSGGHVLVFSEAGIGTTFRVYLPAVEADADTPVIIPDQSRPGRGGTILVAEDDPAVRALVETLLTSNGYQVIGAPNGQAAVALARQADSPIDLLLTDVSMPGLSGPGLADRLRRLDPELPVLFMSGYADAATVTSRFLEQPGAFIAKPFTPDGLLGRVREVLERSPRTRRGD